MPKQLCEQEALSLFKGWFNNKMNIILIKSQYPRLERKPGTAIHQITFLDDLEHHYVRQGIMEKEFLKATRWLKAFFRVYPGRISPARSKNALTMVKTIYDAFGFPMYWNLPVGFEDLYGNFGA